MTNPNNAVGTNAAFSGRTSVNAFNDIASAFSGRGIVSGWGCEASSGMTVTVGGDGNSRDVALAEDNVGNFTTVNNISASPISVTIPAAPATNSRVDSIVAYVVKPPVGTSADTDNPAACGLIVVSGTASASPSAPNDSAIRTAITADGASGSTAYYVVLSNITVANGATTITAPDIANGQDAKLSSCLTIVAPETSVTSLAVNQPSDIQQITIPSTGTWKITAQFRGVSASDLGYLGLLQLKKNGTEIKECGFSAPSVTSTVIALINYVAVVECKTGDILAYSAKMLDHSLSIVDKTGCCFTAEKIA